MYRAITLYFLRNHVDWTDPKEVAQALDDIALEFVPNGKTGESEIFLNYVGTVPAGTTPTDETPAGLGYALELRAYRVDGLLQLDWWYDTGRFDSYTIEELMEQFPFALFEMTSDAAAPV